MKGALTGIRVLDFTTVVAGPYATRLLADCGAEVVKSEPPGGDMLRASKVSGESRYFASYNCGKKSVVLNLKKPDDLMLAQQLADKCDVLVENNRPGVMAKYGLDYESVAKNNPQVVYAALSGFGQTGPMAHEMAYGPIMQAMSGFEYAQMSYQEGEYAQVPPYIGVQVADMVSGVFTFSAIQTALLKRERDGHGDFVDVALLESALALITGELQLAQAGVEATSPYQPIPVTDGHLMVAAPTPSKQAGIRELLEDEGLLQPTLDDGESPMVVLKNLQAWCATRTAAECSERLAERGVPSARYRAPIETLADDQLHSRQAFAAIEKEGATYFVNNAPFRFRNASSGIMQGAPELGEHQSEVLAEWLGIQR